VLWPLCEIIDNRMSSGYEHGVNHSTRNEINKGVRKNI
jgi:hypothetical protein